MIERYNRTLFFYGLSLVIPWGLWFFVAYLSHLSRQDAGLSIIEQTLGLIGLVSTVLVAGYLFLNNRELFEDLQGRFLPKKDISVIYYVMTIGLVFVSLVIAQILSLGFGHHMNQFYISGKPSFSSTVFSPWFILVFAPIVEELAWHSYGTDTLRRRFCLFTTSMIFSVYWVFWHIPLSFIKGYYHANVVAEGWIYSLNFIFSLFVFVILMNWLYYKTHRNVTIAIVFHLTANITNEMFATHPDSKVIQTVLLLFVAVFVVSKERKMFFTKELLET